MRILTAPVVSSFWGELEKIAARVRVMHATNAAHKVLKPRAATGKSAVLASDPNPSAVYMATKRRSARGATEAFGRRAALRHGGTPHLGVAKIDTKKGWVPHQLTRWARDEGWGKEDLLDVIGDLDTPGRLSKSERGDAWKTINKAVGSWRNRDATATVRMSKYRQFE